MANIPRKNRTSVVVGFLRIDGAQNMPVNPGFKVSGSILGTKFIDPSMLSPLMISEQAIFCLQSLEQPGAGGALRSPTMAVDDAALLNEANLLLENRWRIVIESDNESRRETVKPRR